MKELGVTEKAKTYDVEGNRNIKIEIARHPDERQNVNQLIKMSKEEFDRLIETCPDIPDQIITEFKTVFTGNFDYNEIVKPELCGQMVSTERYRNQWSTTENMAKKNNLKQQRDKKMRKFIEKFMDDFGKMNGREPIESEIIDNLKDQIEITQIKQISETILNDKQLTQKQIEVQPKKQDSVVYDSPV